MQARRNTAPLSPLLSHQDGLMHKLLGPLTRDNACLGVVEYAEMTKNATAGQDSTPTAKCMADMSTRLAHGVHLAGTQGDAALEQRTDERTSAANTAALASRVFEHTNWNPPAV